MFDVPHLIWVLSIKQLVYPVNRYYVRYMSDIVIVSRQVYLELVVVIISHDL